MFVYKLTDFGTARELGDNEQFQSLYGAKKCLVVMDHFIGSAYSGDIFSSSCNILKHSNFVCTEAS